MLIVEDDEATRETLMEFCHISGFECDCAKSIPEAKEKAVEFKPEVIYLDLKLGGEIAVDLIPWFREHLNPMPYLVVVSAVPKADKLVEGYNPDCFLPKPFDVETFEKIILEYNC